MLRDVERGGQTEVEHILGFMLNKASEANIARHTFLLAYTHTHIKAFEQRRDASVNSSSGHCVRRAPFRGRPANERARREKQATTSRNALPG
jgi:hypothetical protein